MNISSHLRNVSDGDHQPTPRLVAPLLFQNNILFIDMITNDPISEFFKEINLHQSNNYGYYDKGRLVDAYTKLPSEVKKYLLPNPEKLNRLWRGCDGLEETRVISFTHNKGLAHLFGVYVIPFKEIESYFGLIDTERAQKLSHRLRYKTEIGDDEGEVIVILPVWKPTLRANLRKYFVG